MEVKELGNRILKIYGLPILFGSLALSIILSIASLLIDNDFSTNFFGVFFLSLFLGLIIHAILGLISIIPLNVGLTHIYKNARNAKERNRYFYFL